MRGSGTFSRKGWRASDDNDMSRPMRLNGWQRLWMVLVLAWLVLVLALLAATGEIPPERAVYRNWSREAVHVVQASRGVPSTAYDVRRAYGDLSDVQLVAAIERDYVLPYLDGVEFNRVSFWSEHRQLRVEGPDGTAFSIRTDTDPTEAELEAIAANVSRGPDVDESREVVALVDLAADRRLRMLRAEFSQQLGTVWWSLAAFIGFVWLLPVAIVYAIGWSVGWVVRGFRA